RRVQQTERMRKMQFLKQLDAVTLAPTHTGRRPLADAVQREDRRRLERRWEKSASRVRFMMLREDEPLAIAGQVFAHLTGQMQLLPQPARHGLGERGKAGRSVREIRLQQPLELQ